MFDFVGVGHKHAASLFCEYHLSQFTRSGEPVPHSPATIVGFEDHLAKGCVQYTSVAGLTSNLRVLFYFGRFQPMARLPRRASTKITRTHKDTLHIMHKILRTL